MTVHGFCDDAAGVWGYDPVRRTFYARLHMAAGIRDLGSADEPISSIGELGAQLADVTSTSCHDVKTSTDGSLCQKDPAEVGR
jgi:hypothetical protein